MLKLNLINLTFHQLICLFKVLRTKKLERLHFLANTGQIKFEKSITQSELD